MKTRCVLAILLCILSCSVTRAGMVGDPVTGVLHTAFSGSWLNSSATVGAGDEFSQYYHGGVITLALDISDTTFTLSYTNGIVPTEGNDGSFNLGLDGFEFTDPQQHFLGVTLINSTGGFPEESITNTVVTPTRILIEMDEPIIPGATTWTATWKVTLAPKLSIVLNGGNAVLSWPAEAAGYTLQRQSNVGSNAWVNVVTNTTQIALPATNAAQFFRLIKY